MGEKIQRARSWCFTINNYTFKDIRGIMKNLDADYFIFAFEVGDEGTPHIQGYLQYRDSTVTRRKLSKLMPRARLEIANGTWQESYTYIVGPYDHKGKHKDYNPEHYEFGEQPKQGKRNDLIEVRSDLMNKPIGEVAHEHFSTFLKYGKMMIQYKYLQQKDRTTPPIVEWVYGPTGTGKSSYAYSKSQSVYFKDHTHWWDGYEQQEVIVIDDFDTRWPFRDLLRLLDRYPYQGQIKGGYVKINSKYIIITCDRSIDSLYERILTKHELSQLKRRITGEILSTDIPKRKDKMNKYERRDVLLLKKKNEQLNDDEDEELGNLMW